MKFRKIVALVWAALQYIDNVLPLPNFSDVVAVRAWLLAAVGLAEKVVGLTGITLDNDLIEAIKRVVVNDDTFAALHKLIDNLLHNDAKTLLAASPIALRVELNTLAEKTKLNPLLILGIVEAAVAVIKLFRDLRTKTAPVAA